MLAACPFPSPLGTAVCIDALAQALGERGHDVHVVSYDSSTDTGNKYRLDGIKPGSEIRRAYTHHQADHPPTPMRSGPNWAKLRADWALFNYALKLGRTHRFDVIHAHHIEGILVGAALRKQLCTPLIGQLHTSLGKELPIYLSSGVAARLAGCAGGVADAIVPRLPDAVVTLSCADAERAAWARQSEHNVHIIYPSVDILPITSAPKKPNKDALDASVWIVYSGNADNYQNLSLLAQAMVHLRAIGSPARLLLATHGPVAELAPFPWPADTCMRQVNSFAAMCRLLRAARVGVSPRLQCSGFPIKWLNYWHCGLPLVALRRVGQSVFGSGLDTDLHGRAIWADADAAAFAQAIAAAMSFSNKETTSFKLQQNRVSDYEEIYDSLDEYQTRS